MSNKLKDIIDGMKLHMPHGYKDTLPWSDMVNQAADSIIAVTAKEFETVWLIIAAQEQKIKELETQMLFLRQGKEIIT